MSAERISEKLRALADLIDENPALEQFPELFPSGLDRRAFRQHLVGDEATQVDLFATAFGAEVTHAVHGPATKEPGARYSHVETVIDGVVFHLQVRTEDYEQATGRTVPLPPEEIERRLLAEAEHWSKTPFAHEAGSDGAQ